MQSIVKMIDMQIEKEMNIKDPNQTELPVETDLPSRNEKVLRIGSLEIGTKEVSGSGNNQKVVEYHKYASKSNKVEQPDSVPWCSSFVCYVAEKSGMGSTDSMMARSWLKWGISTMDDPMPGDIVVYWRGSKTGWKGHVGIFLRKNLDGSIVTLGGNQSDEVNVSSYAGSKVLDFRRSSKSRDITNAKDRLLLQVLAESIIKGKQIAIGGSVT